MERMNQSLYVPALRDHGFVPEPEDHRYGPSGLCWKQAGNLGSGYYWIYQQNEMFTIKIHDFYFHEDSFLEFHIPKCLSVTYYTSISGEELAPYRRLNAGCVKTFIGGEEPYRVLIHKKIPIVSIGIEITPAYYEDYLKQRYPGEYADPSEAFRTVDQTDHFPEMVRLLQEVRDYRGDGIAARLFYEGKAAEAVALIVERTKVQTVGPTRSEEDRCRLEAVAAYVNDHCALELPLERLSRIACMGGTKFKRSFKQLYGCTVTEYIQQRRMSQAEVLLAATGLSIGQVAQAVGYRSASRFAQLFRRSTGLSPEEFREISRKAEKNE